MKHLDSDRLKRVMNTLEGDNSFFRKMLLEHFINTAITKPEDVELETVFFVGKLLEKLKNENYTGAREVLEIPSIREDIKLKKKRENIQLIGDVNFLVKNRNFKGAQGALKELVNNSPYYTNFANLNSLQATYRKALKDMTEWSSQDEEMSQELEGLDGAIKGSALMKILYIFVDERDPLI
jgi:hypothetical protein